MKRYLPWIAASFLLFATSSVPVKEELPDLVVTDVSFQQWDTIMKTNHSYISVTIKNKGSAVSGACAIKLYDLDIPLEEAKKQKRFTKRELGMIWEDEDERKNGHDDKNFEPVVMEVPSLKPGESKTLVMVVRDYWVFDPNIDIEAHVDFENKVKEKDEENNRRALLQGG